MDGHVGLELRVLLYRDGSERWIAQALERDMSAHGPTAYAALAAVQLVLQTHINFDTRLQRIPLSRLRPAPQAYWRAYEGAEPLPLLNETSMTPAHLRPAVSQQPVLVS